MSTTMMYAFGTNGNAYLYGETHNAWRGAWTIWEYLEKKYLPPYIPEYVQSCNWYDPSLSYEEIVRYLTFPPTRLNDTEKSKAIWALYNDPKVDRVDKIVLATTFDHPIIPKTNIQEVIDAFEDFECENTSLPEQAIILRKMLADDNVIAVGWNQTSVSADDWENWGVDENGDPIPYNCLTGNEHFNPFDEDELKEALSNGKL